MMDNPQRKDDYERALATIAESRNDDRLRHFLKTGQDGMLNALKAGSRLTPRVVEVGNTSTALPVAADRPVGLEKYVHPGH